MGISNVAIILCIYIKFCADLYNSPTQIKAIFARFPVQTPHFKWGRPRSLYVVGDRCKGYILLTKSCDWIILDSFFLPNYLSQTFQQDVYESYTKTTELLAAS